MSPILNSRFITFLLWRAAIFCFSAVYRKAASFLTSSTNSSSSRKLAALVGKAVSVLVRQVSSVSSMGRTTSFPYVS